MAEADSTRERILDAAAEEFASHGFAGGRVDAIARGASCNKQLIYHYFGNKSGLYEAVTMRVLTSRPPMTVSSHAELGVSLGKLLEDIPKRRSWWRLLLWEALEVGDGPVVGEAQRAAGSQKNVAEIEHAQRMGLVDPRFEPRMLMLALSGMILIPFLMPQLARLMTGASPYDPEFLRRYRELLQSILGRLGPPQGGPPPGGPPGG